MKRSNALRVVGCAPGLLFCLSLLAPSHTPTLAPRNLPPVMLWAWERPEDLSFLDPARAGVAYLAGTITLSGREVLWSPRFQPLAVPEGASVLAVVRIEWRPGGRPECTSEQACSVAERLLRVASKPGLAGIQVDFDAAASQRGFYRTILEVVRGGLPSGRLLSITALASWCLDDRWAQSLPVDEAVAMLFRMGPGAPDTRRRLLRGAGRLEGEPAASFGVSMDEPMPGPLPRGRVYCFNPKPWSKAAFQTLQAEVADAAKR